MIGQRATDDPGGLDLKGMRVTASGFRNEARTRSQSRETQTIPCLRELKNCTFPSLRRFCPGPGACPTTMRQMSSSMKTLHAPHLPKQPNLDAQATSCRQRVQYAMAILPAMNVNVALRIAVVGESDRAITRWKSSLMEALHWRLLICLFLTSDKRFTQSPPRL